MFGIPASLIGWFFGPMGRIVMLGLALFGAWLWAYNAGYNAREEKARIEQAEARARYQQEINNAVARARAARDGVTGDGVPDNDPNLRD